LGQGGEGVITQAVTSMSRAGWALYGAHCIESYARFWPASVPLVVYADEPFDVAPAEYRLTSSITPWKKQAHRWRQHPEPRPQRAWIKPQSYIWDVSRFAVKPYVWLDAAERLGRGALIWLDADTETVAPVPDGLVEKLLGKKSVAYLGRGGMHPETGAVVFRVPEALPLLQWCVRVYQRRSYVGWRDGWTDCHVLRRGLQQHHRIPRRDLTSRRHLGIWHSRIDAMALSPLGPYVRHHKGRRHAAKEVA
jgi:hypothetical protein